MKTYRYSLLIRIFSTVLVIIACIVIYQSDASIRILEFVSFLFCFYLAAFGLTFKLTTSEGGIEIRSLVAPFKNDLVPREDVKKIKYGKIFKEIEYFSKRRNKTISLPILGIVGHLDKEIMKRINQKNIE